MTHDQEDVAGSCKERNERRLGPHDSDDQTGLVNESHARGLRKERTRLQNPYYSWNVPHRFVRFIPTNLACLFFAPAKNGCGSCVLALVSLH